MICTRYLADLNVAIAQVSIGVVDTVDSEVCATSLWATLTPASVASIISPWMNMLLSTTAPPVMINAPVIFDEVSVAFVMFTTPLEVNPPSVPTEVRLDVTTVAFSVVPVSVPAGATTVLPAAAVNWPC